MFLNQALRDFWGIDPADLSNFDWSSTLQPEDIEKLAVPFNTAMEDHAAFAVEARYRRADGQFRTLRTQARPRFDSAGKFLGMTRVNTDITDQLTAEERTRVLMGELNHRTKNILTVVQAVARQTARNAEPEAFQADLGERLKSMAASNDLLLKNNWRGVTLAELVEVQLGHLKDIWGDRILCDGPELRFTAHAAQTLGMAFHELATNSMKYGALQSDEGKVDLTWTTNPDKPGFVVNWVESGSGPIAEPKTVLTRKGFGHTVIVDMIAAVFDADVDIRLDPDGFKWRVSVRSDTALAI